MRIGFGLVLLIIMGCANQDDSPAFMIRDGKETNQVVVVFVPAQKLREHKVTAHQYEEIFKELMDGTLIAVASTVADMFSLDHTAKIASTQEARKAEVPLTQNVFEDLLAHTRLEVWRVRQDGTHDVLKVISHQKGNSQSSETNTASPRRTP